MLRVSKRFACRLVGQHRSTQRHSGKFVDIEEAKLRRCLREITAGHIPLVLTDGLSPAAPGRVAGEPQAGALALAG